MRFLSQLSVLIVLFIVQVQTGCDGGGSGSSWRWTEISAGTTHTCGIARTDLYCWGSNSHGQLGTQDAMDRPFPVLIEPAGGWTKVSSGNGHTCGIRQGTLLCWGANHFGQLGLGTLNNTAVPTQVGMADDWEQVSVGDGYACGLRSGALLCWGNNASGQLGMTGQQQFSAPAEVMPGTRWETVATSVHHTCGIAESKLYCWGQNRSGELGAGNTSDSSTPVRIGSEDGWQTVSLGNDFTCGVLLGALYCWGDNTYFQTGTGIPGYQLQPARVGDQTDWTDVTAGGRHTCGILDGNLYCWGDNEHGQTALSLETPVINLPRQASGSSPWKKISAGEEHTCGIFDSTQYCWGSDSGEKLGNGALGGGFNKTTFTPEPGILLFPSDEIIVEEGGAEAGFYAILTSKPRQDVSLTGFTSVPNQLEFESMPVVFTPENWDIPRRIMVRGMNDHTVDEDESFELQLGPASSSDGRFDGKLSNAIPVTSRNTDVCELEVQLDGSYVYQTGSHVYASVTLRSRPAAPVEVQIQTDPETGLATTPETLTFEPDNWNIPQRFTIVGIPDAALAYVTSHELRFSIISASGDACYQGMVKSESILRYDTGGPWIMDFHTNVGNCAVDDTGTAWCWGPRYAGDGSQIARFSPVAVEAPAGIHFTQITTGMSFSCALDTDRNAWCWGYNYYGQLGNNATNTTWVPNAVTMPAGVGFTRIRSGHDFTLALDLTGKLWAWGANGYGQTGTGSSVDRKTPVEVISNIQEFSAGAAHACAIDNLHRTYCWGANDAGQLGSGTTTSASTPRQLTMQAGVTFTKILAFSSTTCAIDNTGRPWCWGLNTYGGVGDGTTTNRSLPVQLQTPGETFVSLAGARYTVVATATSGRAYAWGRDDQSQLGTGGTTNRLVPTVVDFDGLLPDSVWIGTEHGCGLTGSRRLHCWGINTEGALGDGSNADRPTPVPVAFPGLRQYASLSVRANTGCASDVEGRVWCWGDNSAGQLAWDTSTEAFAPLPVLALADERILQVAVGDAHACALRENGNVWCWGFNQSGQLGNGGLADSVNPILVGAGSRVFNSLHAGAHHTCGLWQGTVYCWGRNDHGQIGNRALTIDPVTLPFMLPDLQGVVTSLSTGANHNCVLDEDGQIWCWGFNTDGQIGDGTLDDARGVQRITTEEDTRFSRVAAGGRHSCALDVDGHIWCWGNNNLKQLGCETPADTPVTSPIRLEFDEDIRFIELAAGGNHTCAVDEQQKLWCWGNNDRGQLGSSSDLPAVATPEPVPTTGGVAVIALSLGHQHTCLIDEAGWLFCWGDNTYAQSGPAGMTRILQPNAMLE